MPGSTSLTTPLQVSLLDECLYIMNFILKRVLNGDLLIKRHYHKSRIHSDFPVNIYLKLKVVSRSRPHDALTERQSTGNVNSNNLKSSRNNNPTLCLTSFH